MNINSEILKTIKYFSIFAYQPTLEEIHTFLQAKIRKNELNIELERMIEQELIKKYSQYTPPQYSIGTSVISRSKATRNLAKRKQISKKKLGSWRYHLYVKLASLFPQIRLIGLSGSISMMNAEENDDIDLFIITAKNRLFTGRLIALVLAQILRLRRSREVRSSYNNETMNQFNNDSRNKVCLNLFFDESNLKVPKFKQTEFVGHEILQMKPVINKNYSHEHFIRANSWVFKLFPNAVPSVIPSPAFGGTGSARNLAKRNYFYAHFVRWISHFVRNDKLNNLVESLLKKLQLASINRHRTTEIITSSQLWFHPDDFEKKISLK